MSAERHKWGQKTIAYIADEFDEWSSDEESGTVYHIGKNNRYTPQARFRVNEGGPNKKLTSFPQISKNVNYHQTDSVKQKIEQLEAEWLRVSQS